MSSERGRGSKRKRRAVAPAARRAGTSTPAMSRMIAGDGGAGLVVFEAPDGAVTVDVRLENETLWLSLGQIATLFGRDKSVVSRHLNKIFASGELERDATVAKNATVRIEGRRRVAREAESYNLDAILSVGYRVNSKRGTQFRIWATRTLKEHLLRGYTLHERRLRETGFKDVEEAVALLARTLTNRALVSDEGRAVLDVIRTYARSWRLLLAYDEQTLPAAPASPTAPSGSLGLTEARAVASALRDELGRRGEAGPLFGQERGGALAGLLGSVEQTFDGAPLYPTVQERAAHILYFVVKDHPFGDGNKRLGALFFLEYLRRNGLLFRADETPRVADDALVALALLVAESAPRQKDLMIRLILSLLDDGAS
jgi:prophage maintenance system killer protein